MVMSCSNSNSSSSARSSNDENETRNIPSSSSIKSRIHLFEALTKTTSKSPPVNINNNNINNNVKAKKPLGDQTNTTTNTTKQQQQQPLEQEPNARSNCKSILRQQQQQQQQPNHDIIITNHVHVRKQLFEAIGQQNKTQNQVLQTKSTTTTFMNRAFHALRLDTTNNYTTSSSSSLCFDGLDDDENNHLLHVMLQQHQRRRQRRRTHIWNRRLWQFLYAMLAIVELLTLLPQIYQETTLTTLKHPPTTTDGWMSTTTPRGSGMLLLIWHTAGTFHIPPWWQKIHTAWFVAAVCMETILTAWDHASQGHYNQQTQKENAILLQQQHQHAVTKRTKGRKVRLETISTNRHVIARWTHNRIRWSQATTEITKWALLALTIRFMFVPILKVNPFLHYFGSISTCCGTNNNNNHKNGAAKRFFFGSCSIRNSKQQQPIQDSEQLLSVAEAMFYMFHSTAVMKLRKQAKAVTVKMIKRLLSQPWKVSSRVQRIFKIIRWAKFLAPLIGTCNKLRGEYGDFRKKQTQRQRSRTACQHWDYLLHRRIVATTTTTLTLEQAARLMQRRYRSKTAPKSRYYMAPPPTCLLLRPNTDFAVRWKRITIACVLLEVVQLSLAPKLAPKNAKKVPIEALITLLLTPSLKRLESFPWLPMAIPWISLRTAEMVSTVSFLDVFISFFTGELDSTGRLVPKDVFTRWVLPGVALQLLVNPTLKDVAQVVGWTMTLAQKVGPMRALHIGVALLPMVQAVVDWMVDAAFIFVYQQNRRDLRAGRERKRAGEKKEHIPRRGRC